MIQNQIFPERFALNLLIQEKGRQNKDSSLEGESMQQYFEWPYCEDSGIDILLDKNKCNFMCTRLEI